MDRQEFYSIGEVSKVCNISKKALRFYDKIGIMSPDKISEENNYRFYTRNTLLSVPVIKYFKQMGFKLEEMKEFLGGGTYDVLEKSFRLKIDELKELESEINKKYASVKEWYDLILEAESVIENKVNEVAVKFIESVDFLFQDQEFHYNYMESIINIEWTNYLDQIANEIKGEVMLHFPSYEDKLNGKCERATIMQRPLLPCEDEQRVTFGGYMAATCYHIGSHETINEAYEKILKWADANGYVCAPDCYERYVTDYWTTKDSNLFVTEVIIKISRA